MKLAAIVLADFLVLNIKDPEADRLARQLAEATGETITRAVTISIRNISPGVTGRRTGRSLGDDHDEIALRCRCLMNDLRTTFLGYGAPGCR